MTTFLQELTEKHPVKHSSMLMNFFNSLSNHQWAIAKGVGGE